MADKEKNIGYLEKGNDILNQLNNEYYELMSPYEKEQFIFWKAKYLQLRKRLNISK